MNRVFRHLIMIVLLSASLLGGCAVTPPAEPDNVCSIFTEKRGWHRVAKAASERWNTSMHVALAIMYQESAFNHKARPPRKRLMGFIPWKRPSTAYGYAQAVNSTWAQYLRATGQNWRERTNFADSTDFVHWYMRQAIDTNGVSSNDAYNLYLNYHEGLAGYKRNTYQAKAWLGPVASQVQARAERYSEQYAACRDTLRPSFLQRLLGA